MTDLAAFLTARLDEEQRLAERLNLAGEPALGPWRVEEACDYTGIREWRIGGDTKFGWIDAARTYDQDTADHFAAHAPARVLAEIAAKRAIIAEVASWQHDYNDGDSWYSCAQALLPAADRRDPEDYEPGSGCSNDLRAGGPCDCGLERRRGAILEPLAAIYADREDFDEAWRAC